MYRAKVLLETVLKASRLRVSAEAKIRNNVLHTQTKCYSTSTNIEQFPNGHSSQYIEDMYNTWLENPASVHAVRFLQDIHVIFF